MPNAFQIEMASRYPGRFDLPVDMGDPMAIEAAVYENGIGDSLFVFLWRELFNADGAAEANLLLDQARRDVEAVEGALSSAEDDAVLHRVLLDAYPEVSMLFIDATDVEAVDKNVVAEETGDSLFEFLWRELKEASGREDAVRMMQRAASDIQEAGTSFEPPVSIGRG